jgi:hypothetical protein
MKREDIEKAAKIYQEQEKDHDIWAGKDLRTKKKSCIQELEFQYLC